MQLPSALAKSVLRAEQTDSLPEGHQRQLVSCIDHTNLSVTLSPENLDVLCDQAVTSWGNVAAICLMPRFVERAAERLRDQTVKIATVLNFPQGDQTAAVVSSAIHDMLNAGADEIDVVMPHHAFLAGHVSLVRGFLKQIRKASSGAVLKVVIETGALASYEHVRDATFLALEEGADFIKTSTGRHYPGVTLAAAATVMASIRDFAGDERPASGIKISGGVAAISDAASYISLYRDILKVEDIRPNRLRIGSSQLLGLICDAYERSETK